MKINKEELRKIEGYFGEISNIISNEGVEIATDNFAFFNPIKLGRELEQIKQKITKIKKGFQKIVKENLELIERLTSLDKIPKKDLALFVTGNLSVFAILMQQIIEEKKEKHKDAWKDVNLNNLRDFFEEKTYEWRATRETIHHEREIRLLVHIAIYCYFLHCRILELDKD